MFTDAEFSSYTDLYNKLLSISRALIFIIQAYSIINVVDKNIRKSIAHLSGSQEWVETSPTFLVFCADLKRAEGACHIEKTTVVSGYIEQLLLATIDATLAAQNAMLAAESIGLGGVFIGGIRNNPDEVCQLLNIPNNVFPVFGMCLGYSAETPEQKPRLPITAILMENHYNSESDSYLRDYNDATKLYYQSRSNNSKYETWTRQIADMMSKPARPHMKEFLHNRGLGIL